MKWNDRCCLARVRLLALSAEVDAGGLPRPGRLARALRPIVGDLAYRLATAPDPGAEPSPADRPAGAEGTQL